MGLERISKGEYLASTPAGDLRMRMTREEIPLEEALDFATRQNPKRRYLFVSRLLGRHIPTPPIRLRRAAGALAAKLLAARLSDPCLFFGLAETATALGQAVFDEWIKAGRSGLYLDTTRRRTGGEIAFGFDEAHSHAPSHLVHLPTPEDDAEGCFGSARTVVVVDDEMTTGGTAENLLRAYECFRGLSVARHVAVLVRWIHSSPPKAAWQTHALLEGSFEFMPGPEQEFAPVMTREQAETRSAVRGSRHGLSVPQAYALPDSTSGRVLVVGAGEYGFMPLLLAERIEENGGEAFLQCTTRSPIALGAAVRHARSFPALGGEGYTEFLYNVPDAHPYDRVILCCEGNLPDEQHPLLRLPRLEARLLAP